MLSYLPWFEVFYKLLNNLADYITKGQTSEMKVMLSGLYKQSIPLAAGSITLQMVPYFIAPDPRGLPSIPENRNLTELIVAVDVAILLQLYASMLFERRILILACKLSTLTSCVHALGALLYPMQWQHIFIPVLPPHLLDYCCAPMPYLIGVHSSLSEKVRSRGLEEVVILNVDTNTLESPFNDLKKIPSDVTSGLKLCLKRQAVSPGCGVSRAFLKSQSLLFGGYRDALQTLEGGEICFNKELFLAHKSPSMKRFLQSAIHLQFFKQFIDGRVDILNTGKVPQDLFEEEILKCGATGKSKSYQELVGSLKKGGGALILNFRSKTNNRMTKDIRRSGLKKRLKHKADNETHTLHRGGSVSYHCAQSDCLQNRLPITQHFGMSRPRRPVKYGITQDESSSVVGDTLTRATSGPVQQCDSELQKNEDEEEESLTCDPEEMDLLGEIFDTLSTRSLHGRGVLYGTRSLDLFGPDSHDYITKFGSANQSEENLSLSISGSGSLHNWNPESTEDAAPPTDDFYWLSLDTNTTSKEESAFEREVQDEERRKEEEMKDAINENHGGEAHGSSIEVEKKEEAPERRVTFGHGSLEEIAAQNKSDESKKTHNVRNKTGKQQGGEKTARMQDDAAEEVNLEDETKEVGFQSQTPSDGFLEKKRTEGLVRMDVPCKSSENVQSCDPKTESDTISCKDGGPTPVKVSELKKRFEAQWSSHTG
uniref:DENN domain-containing protein 1B isoform X2 n=1 Tax=Doryrhamphus excisus TaxID=161450 RepID=UPI0025AE5658|nr:DENN domain-containing protein 1B isoform X2 [Doryrhamphus excisus]